MDRTLITQDRLDELVRLCGLAPRGLMIELGVYKGGSAALLCTAFPSRKMYGIDTYEGLPQKQWNKDEIHKPWDFNDTDVKSVYDFISVDNKCNNFYPIKGIFPDCCKDIDFDIYYDVPTFIHVDLDFYEGIRSSIDFFKDKIVKGGIMVFDDFKWQNCPGVEKALIESGLDYKPTRAKYQAYIQF